MNYAHFGLRIGVPVALLGTTLACGATSLTLSYGSHHAGGGEFLATTGDGWSAGIAAHYAAGATGTYGGILGFETFCIEKDEYFTPGNSYEYQVNGSGIALNGGRNTNSGDPLSVGTAYLYNLFATGGLTGYGYNSRIRAGELQNAFWTLENEQEDDVAPWLQGLLSNEFGAGSGLNDWRSISGASSTFGGIVSAATYGVDAINVGSASSNFNNQDQLIYVGTSRTPRLVPDGGTTLTLLGLTLGGIAAMRRKQAQHPSV